MSENKRDSFSLGISQEEYQLRQSLREGETLISDRLFHLIFGGTLLWGFLMNWVLVQNFSAPLVRLMYSQRSSFPLIIGLVLYFVCVIAGSRMIHAGGLMTSIIGFHLIAVPVGLLVAIAVYGYDSQIVLHALTLTMTIVAIMTLAGTLFPNFFQGIAPILGISLICCIIGELVCSLFFRGAGYGVYDYIVAAIMCLYIGFDWGRVSRCARTANNAVDMAANLYLDIINLFLRILRILARSKDRS